MANEIERGAIRRFATALALTNPAHYDEQEAKAAGYPDLLAPNTFPLTFRSGIVLEEVFPFTEASQIPAEQTLEVFRTLFAGEKVHVVGLIADVQERRGARVVLLEEEGRDDEDQLVYRCSKSVVLRPMPERA